MLKPFLVVMLVFAADRSVAQAPHRIDTLHAQFLFISGDTAYVRCNHVADPDDSIATPYLGAWIACDPPIWRFKVHTLSLQLEMGDALVLHRHALPRRAADLELHCDAAVWDPLSLEAGSAFAASGLIHRSLFRFDSTGRVIGDLAREWAYRGHDLYVVIDTASRFGDGSRVDAQAVKSSLERFFWYRRDAADWSWSYAVAGVDSYRRGLTTQIVGILPRSRDTLQFNLARPFYDLPGYLASPALAIVKWNLEGYRAPVRSTCGPYGARLGDSLLGSTPHRGVLMLRAPDDPSTAFARAPRAASIPVLESRELERVEAVNMPQLLVLRPCSVIDPLLLSFVDFAIDRDGVRSAAGTHASTDLAEPFLFAPEAALYFMPRFDLKRAREARELIRTKPRLRVAAEPGWESVGNYLVHALNAWNCTAEAVGAEEPCDLRVELWRFDSFLLDAYLETALNRVTGDSGDSLAVHLEAARRIEAEDLRSEALRALVSRLVEAKAFIALLRPVARFGVDAPRNVTVEMGVHDGLGRPLGPLFTRRSKP
jgi:hypothetical protein